MTANFANTIFLLAYDRGKVCLRMDENGIKGEDYLKKIIQVSFTLPNPDPQDLFKILFQDIDASIQGFDEKYWDDVRWGNLFQSGFRSLFPTIRDIKRYISSLRLDLAIIGKEEVNPIDFLGIEAIRVFAPDVYLTIADEKLAFTATNSMYFGSGNGREREERRKLCESIITQKSPQGLASAISEIVKQLFPQVKGLYTNTHYGYDWQQEWRKNLQVCAEDIFDKYFSLSIPSSTLSEKSLKDLLASVDDAAAFIKNLKTFQAEGKLRLILDRLIDHLDGLTEQQKEKLIIGIFDFCEGIKDRRLGILDVQAVDDQTWRLGYQTLKRVSKENRVAFLTGVLPATTSVYSPTQLIVMLDHEIELHEKRESLEDPLMSKQEMGELKKVCIDKIRAAAHEGTLVTNQHFDWLLLAWKDLDSEVPVKEYVTELIQTTDGLLALLRGFEWESLSQSADSRVSKRTKKMNKKALADFVDIHELDRRVQALPIEELSQDDRETIKLYNAPPDRFDRL